MLKFDYLFMDTHLHNHSLTSYMNWRLFYTVHYFLLVLFHVYIDITSQRVHDSGYSKRTHQESYKLIYVAVDIPGVYQMVDNTCPLPFIWENVLQAFIVYRTKRIVTKQPYSN
jgi:uncharacterized membrane protein YhaH (DUF805 family)